MLSLLSVILNTFSLCIPPFSCYLTLFADLAALSRPFLLTPTTTSLTFTIAQVQLPNFVHQKHQVAGLLSPVR